MTRHNITLFLLILALFVGAYGLVIEYLTAACLALTLLKQQEKRKPEEKKRKRL
jgi:hypothetical protein